MAESIGAAIVQETVSQILSGLVQKIWWERGIMSHPEIFEFQDVIKIKNK